MTTNALKPSFNVAGLQINPNHALRLRCKPFDNASLLTLHSIKEHTEPALCDNRACNKQPTGYDLKNI